MPYTNARIVEEDYITAECENRSACVLARAIQRATNDPGWLVDGDAVTHAKKDIWHITPAWADELAHWSDQWLIPDAEGETGVNCKLGWFTIDTNSGEMGGFSQTGTVPLQWVLEERIRRGVETKPDGFKFCYDEKGNYIENV